MVSCTSKQLHSELCRQSLPGSIKLAESWCLFSSTSERSAGSVVSVDIGTVVDVDVPMLCSVLSTLSVVATRLPVRLNSEVYGAGATLVELVELVVELALTVVVKVDVSKPTLEVVAEKVSEVAAVAEPVEVVDTVLVTLDVLVDDLVLVNVLVREADVEVTDLVDVVKDWEDV